MKNKKLAFIGLDVVLMGVALLILGLCVGFKTQVNIIGIITIAISLLLPIPLFLFNKKLGVTVATIFLMLANIITSIIFMAMGAKANPKVFGILVGSYIGVFIIVLMISVLFTKPEDQ